MAKFWEASGLFRSAEIAAQTEAAARVERSRTAPAERKPAEPARAATGTADTPERAGDRPPAPSADFDTGGTAGSARACSILAALGASR